MSKSTKTTMKKSLPIILIFFAIAAIILILLKFNLPMNTFFWREIHNWGHIPLFGIMSVLILNLSFIILRTKIQKRYLHYIFAFCITIMLGVMLEYLQISGPRDADIWDVVRDIIGAIIFLGAYLICDGKMAGLFKDRNKKFMIILAAGLLMLIIFSILPAAIWGSAYLYRNWNFPIICGFESILENKFLEPQDAKLEITALPEGWQNIKGEQAGRLTFLPAEYPGLNIKEPYPDWTAYGTFCFSIYSELEKPIALHIRIDDLHYNQTWEDRFNYSFTVLPGFNQIDISIEEIRQGLVNREMDMTAIAAVLLFAHNPPDTFSFYIDDIMLK
ncbi:MAG: VanZ family protein [candidate division Zixibacteria bacterium]|nr:VanZ family protein [candidate division Zixibacteria bacterium]